MKKILLFNDEEGSFGVKNIVIFDRPEKLRNLLSGTCWEILKLLSEREMYPMEVARKLGIHEQRVYYHIRKLVEAGVIEVVREEERKGAIARYYKTTTPALGVELPLNYQIVKGPLVRSMDEKLRAFFDPIIRDGIFNGRIVVGSPDPHGPFKARARDGHYASYLSLFLGQFINLPEDFIVKLDVDIKAEKDEEENLILVGGPGTNLVTKEVNDYLPVRFNMASSRHGFLLGGLVSERTGNIYTGDTVGVVAKIVNPWNEGKRIIVLAGNKAVGTKACVLALTKFWKKTLKNFSEEEAFATVIQGFDLDGDGKVDSIEILE